MTSICFIQCIIKQIFIRFGSCDVQDNQGVGKGYQPQASAYNSYLIIMIVFTAHSTSQDY